MNDHELDALLRRHLGTVADPRPTPGLLQAVASRVGAAPQQRSVRSLGRRRPAWRSGMVFAAMLLGTGLLAAVLGLAAATLRPTPAPAGGANGWIVVGAEGRLTWVTPDGMAIGRTLDDASWRTGLAWSPDGTRLAFWAGDDAGEDLFIAGAMGEDPVKASSGVGSFRGRMSWAPDGSAIAVAASGITVFDLRGTPDPAAGYPSRRIADGIDPAWSPRGDWIAFHARYGDGSGVRIVATGSPAAISLSEDGSSGAPIHWAPDGASLTFEGGAGGPWTVSVPGGGDQRRAAGLAAAGAAAITWSPDGTRVAWPAATMDGMDTRYDGIMVAGADGSDPLLVAGSHGLQAPIAWSPDGSMLVATHWAMPPGTPDGLWLLDVAGARAPIQLPVDLDCCGTEPAIAWQPIAAGAALVPPPAGTSSTEAPLSLVGLGDSIPGNARCVCPGYVERYGELAAQALGRPVTVTNLATNDGLRSETLLDRVREDATYRTALAGADLITITIGFNDGWQACDWHDAACWETGRERSMANLAAILAEIAGLRADGTTAIRVTGYPDLYLGHPDTPDDPAFQPFWREQLLAFNAQACDVAEVGGAACVDLMPALNGPARDQDAAPLLASDHIHPNAEGNAAIARAIAATGFIPLQ